MINYKRYIALVLLTVSLLGAASKMSAGWVPTPAIGHDGGIIYTWIDGYGTQYLPDDASSEVLINDRIVYLK